MLWRTDSEKIGRLLVTKNMSRRIYIEVLMYTSQEKQSSSQSHVEC